MNAASRFFFPLFLFLVLLSVSCNTVDVFEKNVPLQDQRWPSALKPEISFAISDTSSLYNLYVVLRHTDAYRYNNLWMNVYTHSPGDSATIAQALDLQLGNNEKGWLGSGMDDIYEHRIRITQGPIRLKEGVYRFKLEQIMRDDPLDHILNVGVRVEKSPN